VPATCPSAGAARVNHGRSREVELVRADHDIRRSGPTSDTTSQADSAGSIPRRPLTRRPLQIPNRQLRWLIHLVRPRFASSRIAGRARDTFRARRFQLPPGHHVKAAPAAPLAQRERRAMPLAGPPRRTPGRTQRGRHQISLALGYTPRQHATCAPRRASSAIPAGRYRPRGTAFRPGPA